ncbi:MAG: ABC transporter permease [Chitinophagaceae bacterium]
MFRNYLKTAWRNIVRNRQYAVLNIAGLSIGLAVSLMIGLWTYSAFQYNKNFKHYNAIGMLMVTGTFSGEKETDPICSPPFVTTLRNKYGNYFQHVTLSTHAINSVFAQKDRKVEDMGVYADPEFFEIFQPTLLQGNYSTDNAKNGLFISASLAKKLFGTDNPIDQPLRINGGNNLLVKGVYEDFPDNSSFYKSVQYIAPLDFNIATLPYSKSQIMEAWNINRFTGYAQLNPAFSAEQVSHIIKNIALEHELDIRPETMIHPMSKWHLYGEFKNGKNTGGLINVVRLFIGVGIGVLLLAISNFVNLATAQNAGRAREVGVRKAIGAGRGSLIAQFLTESMLFVFISGIVALVVATLCVPLFQRIIGSTLAVKSLGWNFIGSYMAVLLFTGLLGGFYPAFYLSSFQTTKVLKGQTTINGKTWLRKSLIVGQFFVATVLMFMTLLVWRQVTFVKSRPLGYNPKGLIYFNTKDTALTKHFEVFRTALIHSGVVANAAISTAPVQQLNMSNGGFDWKGAGDKQNAVFGTTSVSTDFASTVGWQFVQGRNFSVEHPSDSTGILLNQAAANYIGDAAKIGNTINFRGDDFTIVGIIKNPVMNGPFDNTTPSVFFFEKGNGNYVTMRLNPKTSASAAVAKIEKLYKQYSPDYPLNLLFVDTQYGINLKDIERSANLIGIFSILSIVIGVLGLFGLSSYAVEQKRKEIGIRKVLGAPVFVLWKSFAQEFLLLVTLSFTIAVPVSLTMMRNWLAAFDYRTTISPYLFIIGIVLSICVALFAISFKILKAVRANPVDSLRTE